MSPSNLNDRLKRFGKLIAEPVPKSPTRPHPERYHKLAHFLNGELIAAASGAFCLTKTIFPLTHFHGTVFLEDTLELPPLPRSAFTPADEPGEITPTDLLFLDTET